MGYMSIKLDISKAFDCVEWPFVLEVLKSLGYPAPFVNFIHICLSSSSFSFLLNGSQFGSVLPQRGILQGDSLSPYIFIICAKVFSSILQDLQVAGKIHGIQINRHAPIILHLCFTDDTILFGNATLDEARHLKFAIDLFERASGQQINYDKSGIHFSPNTYPVVFQQIVGILSIPVVSSHDKYLGLPLVIGKNKWEDFSSIQDRVCNVFKLDTFSFDSSSIHLKLDYVKNKKCGLPAPGQQVLDSFACLLLPSFGCQSLRLICFRSSITHLIKEANVFHATSTLDPQLDPRRTR
ncbi:hypothetical protein DH2020_003838 [Rehmannia glutinosa]|uniref:Reverse transcriptase domain-containing protein n=1 Tax=Rehmannia glutinosa TaxID=99300 RepID=A0ABR0XMQ6_REHGL